MSEDTVGPGAAVDPGLPPEFQAAQRAAGLPEDTFAERLAAAPGDAQALYRGLLRSLAAGAGLLSIAAAGAATGLSLDGVRAAVAALVAADLIAVDRAGTAVGVFPLSARVTRHVVRLADGRQLYAMCAVDALGVPAMLGQAGAVLSADPVSGRVVRVEVPADVPSRAPTAGWVHRPELIVDPPEAVVLLARAGAGPLASDCCSVIDFYTDAAAAHAALDARGLTGVVLPIRVGHALGVHLFGRLPAT